MLAILAAAAVAAAAAPKPDPALQARMQPDGRIILERGERAALRFDAAMKPTLVSIEKAQDGSVLENRPPKSAEPVTVTFGQADGTASMVVVETRLDQAFNYGAVIGNGATLSQGGGRGYQLRTTSTCTVAPQGVGLERWSDKLDIILLGPFTKVAPDQMSCQVRADLPAH
jgi:hypothetical protein